MTMTKQELRPNVPCGSCRACCRHEYVVLFPEYGDDPKCFDHVPLPGTDLLILRQLANGDCVYLGEGGCTIHERAPAVCRRFDCRTYFLSMTRNERRMHERADLKVEIFEAARKRLHSLTPGEIAGALARRGAPAKPSSSIRLQLKQQAFGRAG
jgi:hypothetical protein